MLCILGRDGHGGESFALVGGDVKIVGAHGQCLRRDGLGRTLALLYHQRLDCSGLCQFQRLHARGELGRIHVGFRSVESVVDGKVGAVRCVFAGRECHGSVASALIRCDHSLGRVIFALDLHAHRFAGRESGEVRSDVNFCRMVDGQLAVGHCDPCGASVGRILYRSVGVASLHGGCQSDRLYGHVAVAVGRFISAD